MATASPTIEVKTSLPVAAGADVPFGVNEVRLNARQWVLAFGIIGVVFLCVPEVWKRIEQFDTGPDYRIPYALSKDYWLYGRRIAQVTNPDGIILLGDSVVWGEYVLPDGTLSHFLNQQTHANERFVNGGLNGLFPLAQEGLVTYYSKPLRRQKVLIQCNMLWLTSPKADLSTPKEEQFNHSRLVPQFSPRIPCYKADTNERLSSFFERHVSFFEWVDHLQNAYFSQKSILRWTLQDNGSEPPEYPNACKNPFSQITLQVPAAPADDPQRGPMSPRHKSWSTTGQGSARFEWVNLESSLQWQAFQRVIKILRERGNDVLIVLGPFNEHIMAEENRPAYAQLRDDIAAWLTKNNFPTVVPETLPSLLYADASHPLTEGYELLARQLLENKMFCHWLQQGSDSHVSTAQQTSDSKSSK